MRKLCLACCRGRSKVWYKDHKEYKIEHVRQQRLQNVDWLAFVKANLHKMSPEEKLQALFDDSYNRQGRCPDGY
jgi:hypothetical protein